LLFAHRLVACGIGGQTVAELEEAMDLDEFYRWQAYFQMHPIGNEDLQFALLRRTLYAVNATKSSQVPPLRKFMLGDTSRTATADELEAKLDILTGQ
jgi:hypothetical protein